MYKCKDGYYYIVGDFCDSNFDPVDKDIKGRFRRRSGDRDKIILEQARLDGEDCHVIFPLDAGAAGKVEFEESAKKLIEEGFVVKKDPTPAGKSKLVRYTPFASAAEAGLIRIVESSFPDKQTLNYFYTEQELFDGERSSSARKDDVVDAVASAFNYLARQKVLPSFSLGKTSAPTKLGSVKQLL